MPNGNPASVDQLAAPMPSAADGKAHRAALFIVFLVVVIDLLGFGIVLPLLSIYGNDYLRHLQEGSDQGFSGGLILGLLTASFSLMQFIFAPIWGKVSDRIGRRPVLLLGLLGSVVFYGVFGAASLLRVDNARSAMIALTLLFVYRIGAGVAGATIATAQAVIADCTTPERRSRGMALIGAAFGIGFTFGPLVGILALKFGNRATPGFLASGLSLAALMLGWRLLPETLRPGTTGEHRRWLDLQGLRAALRTPTVGVLIATFFLATFAFANFESTLSLFTEEVLGLTTDGTNITFIFVGFTLVVVQGLLYRRLAARVSEQAFLRVGILCLILGMIGMGAIAYGDYARDVSLSTGSVLGFGVTLAVIVTGFAFLTPSVQSLISRRTDPSKQGEILGINQSAAALARILGPLIGLSLFKTGTNHVLPYAASALLLLGLGWYTSRIR